MKVFLQSIFGQLIFSMYILWRGRQALPPKKVFRLPFKLAVFIELLVYFTGFFFHEYLPDEVFVPLMFICNTWYIASMYITMILLGLTCLHLLHKRWAWYPAYVNYYWARTKATLFILVTAGVVWLMIFGYNNVRYPSVQHVYITIPKIVEGRDSLTVVMTADWHIGEVIRKSQVQRIVSLCNAQNPDITFIVGDIVDYEMRFAERAHIEEDLRELRAPLGVYMTLGNHEYRANIDAKKRWIAKTGLTLLVDTVVAPADSSFYVVGRDDYINHEKRAPLAKLMRHLDTSKPIIVLDHQPNRLNEIVMNQADLGLHGHTHNGQVWPYSILLNFVYECVYGYYRKGMTQFFITSGVGIAGPPYRIGTHSEIVVLHIRFDKYD